MSKKEKKAKQKGKGLWAEFKAFISRGNVLDMAVGVVIGGAFGAIVTALVNILLSLCTAAVPGGLAGFITILPTSKAMETLAIVQEAIPGAKLELSGSEFLNLFNEYGASVSSVYTQYGGRYVLSAAPVLNWGALINAIISFLIIALVLFAVVKSVATINAKKEAAANKAKEAYYEKHPEERPAPVEPGVPAPTEVELLTQIKDLLAEQQKK